MFCKRALLPISLMFVSLAFGAQAAKACSCGGKPTVLTEYEWANVVVVVQVTSVEKSEKGVDRVRYTKAIVEEAFKGKIKAGEEIVFGQGGGADCIWTFRETNIGERFLFYLVPMEKEQKLWWAGTCGRSRAVAYAADDLLYLRNMAVVRGKTRLSGTK